MLYVSQCCSITNNAELKRALHVYDYILYHYYVFFWFCC